MAGFRDEDEDFGDLLARPTGLGASSGRFDGAGASGGGFGSPTAEEDLSSNPFADMQSSASTYLPPASPSAFYSSSSSPPMVSPGVSRGFGAATGAYEPTPSRSSTNFLRESAPEPETPSFSRTLKTSTSSYSPYDATSSADLFGAGAGGSTSFASASSPPQSPFQTSYSPPATSTIVPAADEQTPFGSPPPLSPVRLPTSIFDEPASSPSPFSSSAAATSIAPPSIYRPAAPKPDLSALLGEEKPILPSFRRREPKTEGVAGPLGSKIAVLPVSSIGKKTVPGALATLLGLEVEEDVQPAAKKPSAAVKGKAADKEKGKAAKEEGSKDATPASSEQTSKLSEAASAPSTSASSKAIAPVEAESSSATPQPEVKAATTKLDEATPSVEPVPAPAPPESTEPADPPSSTALSTALPDSRPDTPSEAPISDDATVTESVADAEALRASLSRASSQAASMRSVISTDNDNEEDRTKYDAIVSPMDTGDANPAWPSNKGEAEGATGVDGLEQKLEALQVGIEKGSSIEPAPESEFAQYIFQERPAEEEPTLTTDHATGVSQDADSTRGTYTRSSVGNEEDENEAERRSIIAAGVEASSSPPLPPVPKMSSPTRSTQAGGSLGPSFIISVGDPQKVGNPLNVAAQHTVYTVRTRTTSSAFRKSDFSVLRRFSHFLWLFDALTINNPGVIVPGMPEKSAMGRFGSEFVENRRQGLQAALMKIVAHPMLVGDPDLRLFLESDSFAVDIKQRKLDVPSESKGFLASIGSAISGPSFVEFDDYFDTRRHQLESFETQLRSLIVALSNASKVRHGVQDALVELQTSLSGLASCDLSKSLRGAIEAAARVQKNLHDLGERQSASEEQIGGLINVAETYARLCASARGVFGARIKAYHTWHTAEATLKKSRSAHDKAKRAGRGTMDAGLGLAVAEVAEDGHLRLVLGDQAERKALDAKQDFEDVSKLTKAEMARFDKEKVDDFKKAVEAYADGMAERQREVVVVWQEYYEMLQIVAQAHQAKVVAAEQKGGADETPTTA